MSLPKELLSRYYMSTRTALDELIYGWPKGRMALVFGHFKSGKTTLAMMASIIAMEEGKKALYLDAENRVTPIRFHQLASAMAEAKLIERVPNIPKQLFLWTANSLKEQHDLVMNDMVEKIEEGDVGVAVIDSIAIHYHSQVMNAPREMMASVAREIQGRLETEIHNLQKAAAKSGTCVIVTSWSASQAKASLQEWQRKQVERGLTSGELSVPDLYRYLDVLIGSYGFDFVGGQYLGYRAHFLLRIFRVGADLRHAYLVAHGDRPDGYGMYMVMRDHGLVPVEGAKVEKVSEVALKGLIRKEEEIVREEMEADEPRRGPKRAKKEG